jgi:hypothetical protein
MGDVIVTLQLEADLYQRLLTAANEVGVPVSEFAGALVANYVEDNYAEV